VRYSRADNNKAKACLSNWDKPTLVLALSNFFANTAANFQGRWKFLVKKWHHDFSLVIDTLLSTINII